MDEWIYFLKHESIRDDFKSKNIQKAKEKLDILKMGQEERKRYERYLMNLASEIDIIGGAREEGKEEGRKDEKIEIAKKMRQDGLPMETILKYTSLTREEFEKVS